MTLCIIVVYIIGSIFSSGANLKIDIGWNGSHFKTMADVGFL